MHFTQKRLTGIIKYCSERSSNHHLLTWHLKHYSIDPGNLNCNEFYLPSHQGCFSLNPQVHHFMVFPGTKFSTVDGPYYQSIQWNPVNTVTNGPKKFGHINAGVAVLTRVFYQKMYGCFCQVAKKSGCNNEVAVLPRWS